MSCSRLNANTVHSQNGLSSVTNSILLIKDIQISGLQNKSKNLSFSSSPRAKLVFSIDNITTETKSQGTVWSEHLTFELSPPIKDNLHVKCYDMSKKGDDGLFGEAEIKLSSYKGQKEKVSTELFKHRGYVGKIYFYIYFLSGNPPKDADLNLHDESLLNDKIRGVLLLKNITCKGMSRKGYLEFSLNNRSKLHTTKDYWKMSSETCEYDVSFDLIKKEIRLCIQCRYGLLFTGFSKTKLEIKSTDTETWKTLIQTGTIKSGDLPFVENGFEDGYTSFIVSFHSLTTFEEINKKCPQ
ncbi:5088_t:CDS:2, partial [Ambispora gerdemannii]